MHRLLVSLRLGAYDGNFSTTDALFGLNRVHLENWTFWPNDGNCETAT